MAALFVRDLRYAVRGWEGSMADFLVASSLVSFSRIHELSEVSYMHCDVILSLPSCCPRDLLEPCLFMIISRLKGYWRNGVSPRHDTLGEEPTPGTDIWR